MPYLPVINLDDTELPTGVGSDYTLQLDMMSERWRKFYPQIDYFSMRRATTVTTDLNVPVGGSGATKFDPLYHEPIDSDMTTVVSPQGTNSANYDAGGVEVYAASVRVHARVRVDATDAELKRWGFDKVRDLIVQIPCVLLDTAGIGVRAGDKFRWGNTDYDVMQQVLDGRWRNTNIRFYVVINAQQRRPGA